MNEQTVEAAIDLAEQLLVEAGVWTPRADAETLTAYVLGVDRVNLSLQALLTTRDANMLHQLVAKRVARVPLAYITGHAVLGGVDIEVGPGVFIPRAHTEQLLVWGLQMIHDRLSPRVIDLCTGSGAIALAVAHARPDAIVLAVDNDPVALEFAHRNAHRQAAIGSGTIQLYFDDVTRPTLFAEFDHTVDLILANPPNVVEGRSLRPEWSEYQPSQALYAGDDGFGVIYHVINLAARLLCSGGGLAIEHDDGQAESLTTFLRTHGAFTNIKDHVDYRGQSRFTTAQAL